MWFHRPRRFRRGSHSSLSAAISQQAATAIAAVCGGMAGAITGILATRFRINGLLAGILGDDGVVFSEPASHGPAAISR
ncbi:MAG: hypothetical protein U0936_11530 [Planctomycetaceae bacterium]